MAMPLLLRFFNGFFLLLSGESVMLMTSLTGGDFSV